MGMQQLSGLDASFLFLETAEMPMHVGALQSHCSKRRSENCTRCCSTVPVRCGRCTFSKVLRLPTATNASVYTQLHYAAVDAQAAAALANTLLDVTAVGKAAKVGRARRAT